jgi:dienelactone hydrolase
MTHGAETQVTYDIPGTDLRVYGLLREVEGAPIIVTIHGLGGTLSEHIHYNGAKIFSAAGYSVLRVSLYGGELDSRNLAQCDVDTHVNDVSIVLKSLRQQGKRIAIVGHSLGGLVVQRTDRDLFDVAVLWDPVDTQQPDFTTWDEAEWNDDHNMWVMHWGADVLVSKALENSWWHAQPDHHDLGKPTKIIAAGDTWMSEPGKRYALAQSGPSQYVSIDGADHGFKLGDQSEQLHIETLSWIQQHL